jgi:xylulokinase
MNDLGATTHLIRAGHGNLFLSPIFRQTLSTLTDARILLYNTDGSIGAARGAGIGVGIYSTPRDAFQTLQKVAEVTPHPYEKTETQAAYDRWLTYLTTNTKSK